MNNLSVKSFYLLLISFLVTFTILISLGVWQTYRLQEKESYVKHVFDNLKREPIEVLASDPESLAVYQKIKVSGKLIAEKVIWIYRRHPDAKYQDGAYLFVPLLIGDDKYLLATLGWVTTAHQEKAIQQLKDIQNIAITGILLNGEENSIFLPKNDYAKKIFFTIDLREIRDYLTIDAPLLYLASLENDKDNELSFKKITPEMLIKIKNDHLEYAVTWFTLAGILFIFYILYLKKMQYFSK